MRERTTGASLPAMLLAGLLLSAGAAAGRGGEAADRPQKASTLSAATLSAASLSASRVSVGARVVPYARVERHRNPPTLVITEDDIERGVVSVPDASQLLVATNSRRGYRLRFRIEADYLRRVEIDGLGTTVILASRGGWVERRAESAGVSSLLSYELYLTEDAAPGRYPWPLAITAESLRADG